MGSPFSRAIAAFAAVHAALQLPASQQRGALASIPTYVSRGKGEARRHDGGGVASARRKAFKASCQRRNKLNHRGRA